ncbi:MAG: hypothetical protein ACJ0QO_02170 [Parvicellaceae bacterium]
MVNTIDTDNLVELYKGDDQKVEDFKNELLLGDIDGVIFLWC